MFARFFKFQENGTTLRREVAGGVTTFMTMAYIIFVQPVVMHAAGMDLEAVLVATCLSSALATFIMGVFANYPIALAPAMGHNFFFTYTVVLALGYTWQQALGAIFIAGSLFILLSTVGLREKLINALPNSLKHAIAVGIGLLIAMVGLQWSGVVVDNPGTLVGLGDFSSPPVLLSLFGLTVMIILLTLGVKAAILIGILLNLAIGLATGMITYQGVIGAVPSLQPTFLKLDIAGALQPDMIAIIFIFFFLALFDTVGTLVGVSQQAGLLQPDGTLPRAREALISDAVGTVIGAGMGTSTITSYIESAAGVSAGARTGFANIVTGLLFLLAIFFAPLLRMVGGGIEAGEGMRLYPVIAPALVAVGVFMLKNVKLIPWEDFSEAIPAFLTMIIMPLTLNITEGISFGFISYTLLKTVRGKFREVPWLISLFAALFVLRYVFLQG
ncbi:MAG: NCS2 family permease [Calditrichaceae bacterium]|nr:NCS2 family permease [Calditrichia bacterium]NUQ42899.1 NCS2 family permease [Calditrichaceae bacterium]